MTLLQDSKDSANESRFYLVLQVLKSINFKDESTFCIGNNGLKVTLEESKCFQANAFVPKEIFSEFTFEEADMTFNVSLLPVIECINLIGMGPVVNSISSVSATALGISTTFSVENRVLILNFRWKRWGSSHYPLSGLWTTSTTLAGRGRSCLRGIH